MSMLRMSVVIRSYNRLDACCELIEALLGQDHESFEVIVVEQSTITPAGATAKLAALERDPRLRILRVPPQGGAGARNLGVEHTRGEVVVFIDDDDLPVGNKFLTEIEKPFLEDPRCIGASCRQFWTADRSPPSRLYRWFASW